MLGISGKTVFAEGGGDTKEKVPPVLTPSVL